MTVQKIIQNCVTSFKEKPFASSFCTLKVENNLPFWTKSGGDANKGADGANASIALLFGTGGGGEFGFFVVLEAFAKRLSSLVGYNVSFEGCKR